MQKTTIVPSKSIGYLSILIFPLTSLYICLRYFRKPEAKNIFWFFCIFLGMVHIVFPEGGSGADGVRYAERLAVLHQQAISWENFAASLYSTGGNVDIFQPLVTYLVSLITDNPQILFVVFATIFGFFYSRNMWFVLDKLPSGKLGFPTVIFLCIFFLVCPIWNINGVRMWTALHVFVYGALPFLYDKENKKIVWCFASLLVHFSFFVPLAILLVYRFAPKWLTAYFCFYLFSYVIQELDLGFVKSTLSFLPGFLDSRVDSYTDEEYAGRVAERQGQMSWHVYAANRMAKLALLLLTTMVYIVGKKVMRKDAPIYRLFCFSLLFCGFANIVASVPSGGRFLTVANMFLLPSIILFYVSIRNMELPRYVPAVFNVAAMLLLFPVIFNLRRGTDFYGISLLLNPLLAPFVEDTRPFITTIKSLLT